MLLTALFVSCLPVVGVAIFSGYLYWRFGDPIAWVHGQAAWGVPIMLRAGAPDPGKLPGEQVIKPIEVIVWIGNIAAFVAAVLHPAGHEAIRFAYGAWIAVNIFRRSPRTCSCRSAGSSRCCSRSSSGWRSAFLASG